MTALSVLENLCYGQHIAKLFITSNARSQTSFEPLTKAIKVPRDSHTAGSLSFTVLEVPTFLNLTIEGQIFRLLIQLAPSQVRFFRAIL